MRFDSALIEDGEITGWTRYHLATAPGRLSPEDRLYSSTHRHWNVGQLGTAMAATLILSACGNQMGGGSMGGMDMGGTSKSAKATLVPANAVTGDGAVTVAVVENQVHVDVRTKQLTATTKYTVHLHKGSCAAIGDIIKTVGDLQTDASGTGAAHVEYGGSNFPTPAFVDVHPPDGTEGPAVCGDLQ